MCICASAGVKFANEEQVSDLKTEIESISFARAKENAALRQDLDRINIVRREEKVFSL